MCARHDDGVGLIVRLSIFTAVMLVPLAVVYVYRKRGAVRKGGTQ